MSTTFVFPPRPLTATHKPRPPSLVFHAKLASPTVDARVALPDTENSYAVSPGEFDTRSVSSISSPASSACSSPETNSDSVLATVVVAERPQSDTLVGFGRKQHFHRHSVAVTSSQFFRKHEHRHSLPGPVTTPIEGVQPQHHRRLSLAPVYESTASSKILGSSLSRINATGGGRRGPKPLLLPQQLKSRQSFAARARHSVLFLSAFAMSYPIEFVLNRLAMARRRSLARQQRTSLDSGDAAEKALIEYGSDDEESDVVNRWKKVLMVYRFLRALATKL
ncbi:hypothetical protein HMN09_00597400 [Mycena chlorophos]|uniref:Uncharacterized protein n=1 Tax=Mycena chlorophos TaxID=658473 RepID=A0A8H6WBR3_MYCCL|nr:hypothetical protein HMN09_00597400 [Mycena chlorophos]